MASGYGLHGGPSRCFPFWQELLACYVVNSGAEDNSGAAKCIPALDDYYECLHHPKEYARALTVQRAYRRHLAAHPREHLPSAEQIRHLGVLGQEHETEAVLSAQRAAAEKAPERSAKVEEMISKLRADYGIPKGGATGPGGSESGGN